MIIEQGVKYDFCDVLLKPKRTDLTSRIEVNVERTIVFKHSGAEWTGVPIIAANMDTVGTLAMYEALHKYKMLTAFHKFYTLEDFTKYGLDKLNREYYMLTTGIKESEWEKTKGLIEVMNPKFLMIDVANGYSVGFVEFCRRAREEYPHLTIFAGNVATSDMVQELLLYSRVDVVKCGIGSGAVCITRLKTGVGVPQLSVCIECSETANGLGGHIVSDGGCVVPGDIVKAFCGGAHFVMLGSMLAGHDESGGELVEEGGKKYKLVYGMSSEHAQNKHYGGMALYRSSEGKVRKVEYRGAVDGTIMDILGSIRSACTYISAHRLKDMPKCTTFILTNRILNTSLDKGDNMV